MNHVRSFVVVVAAASAASFACAQNVGVPSYDFQWATVGDLNNPGYDGPTPFGLEYLLGRGSVGYEYRISRLEVTTAQWMEFLNTVGRVEPQRALGMEPLTWGARRDLEYQGPGVRWRLRNVADAMHIPVSSIGWREAALMCNWLHNSKGDAPISWLTGAYDASTFTFNPDGTFNDQPAHAPDAKFWIPTLDEWMKAAWFDPARDGEGQGGWWEYPYQLDSPPIPGPPSDGSTSAGWSGAGLYDIPLGAYAEYMSAYGLWDTSGGTSEWVEELFYPVFPSNRGHMGSYAGDARYALTDHASIVETTIPTDEIYYGVRLASRVPSPSGIWICLVGLSTVSTRARRSSC